ncbi:DUF3861 domain-containing protein [Hymenobacter sp. AT01-02]|uniref:DUF3861 domain-containing protein n=1 Tax=Hymenobacter sp. AT01-02 TaxID=1571877 RepID=UPI0005F1B342|nr:DUF3861 domain-containing protein [Hymenobacter sp. AT01-02]
MSTKHHQYRLTLEHEATTQPEQALHAPVTFSFANHDDLFAILDRVRSAQVLPDEEAASLALGVKLLGNVLLAHRHEPLFTELWQAHSEFVQKLKSHSKASAA